MTEQKHSVCILLAVWGERFIIDFLELSLGSLLAQGNIPAMAKEYPTRFVFLSSAADTPVFEKHPGFQRLLTICPIEFLPIDDLIVFGNYSTTLTLAYDRAIQQTGNAMLETYFIFLTSDYIMADGSMEGLIRYMKKGYSGICAGNFQVLQEEMENFLINHKNPQTQILSIKPRDLLAKSFQNLHAITIASILNQPAIHNYHANRLFIRVDHQVLAARFYLLHMLCIKPETTQYQIGSSCDYSFIQEMCPSGNTAIINDSDDYLVVEIQDKYHESKFVHWGAYQPRKLAKGLSEWTTARHRKNAEQTIYFHSRAVKDEEKKTIEKNFDIHMNEVSEKLNQYQPQPIHNHPYWLGVIHDFKKQQEVLCDDKQDTYKDLTLLDHTRWLKKMFFRTFGIPPNVYPWHPRYRENLQFMQVMKKMINIKNSDSVIVFYDSYHEDFMHLFTWLNTKLNIKHHFFMDKLIFNSDYFKDTNITHCVFMTKLGSFGKLKSALCRLSQLSSKNLQISVIVPNENNKYSKFFYDFCAEFSKKLHSLMGIPYYVTEIKTINNNLTSLATMVIAKINRKFDYSRFMRFISYILIGAPGALICFILNCFPNIFRKSGHCTQIIATLKPEERQH